MANLKETSYWEEGIYQWETSDPVLGGENGIDNVPTRQLANRTKWLKDNKLDKNSTAKTAEQAKKSDTADKLTNSRLVGGVPFDGSSNINLPGVNLPGKEDTSGNAATATKLQVVRTINGVQFDGTKDINVTPAGAVQFFAMNWVPTGWLKANGAEVSRTTYANLFAAIGFTYGEGDGKTTFNLPDLRGEFLRGWDDGRGVDDEGRIFGDTQADAIRNITGRSEVLHVQTLGLYHRQLGALKTVEQCQAGAAVNMGTTNSMSFIEFDASKCGIPVAGENRPRNVALLACIKI